MAMQTAKSGLLAKLGTKGMAAHAAAKDKEVDFGNMGDLPEGIEGGIAQLVECKFDVVKPGKQNAGEYFFYAAGIVVAPREHAGVRIAGLRTVIMEMMCDTPTTSRKTVQDHIDWVYNELRKLGVDTAQMKFEDLEAVAAALKKNKPHFRFRTWKGAKQTTGAYANKEPRVQHNWSGVVEDYVPPDDAGSGVVDNTAPPDVPTEEPAPVEGDPGIYDDSSDVASLVEVAKNDDDPRQAEAQAKLNEMAVAAGHSDESVNLAESWDAVAEMISTPPGDDAAPEPEWEPAKGDPYKIPSIDPKTKKPAVNPKTKKPVLIEVEVLTVDKAKKTVTAKNLDTGKPIVGADPKKSLQIPWGDLVRD